ncbi:MAG: hypothetical protein WC595_01090 [Candidatus Nanoarchaeia archaeon]
MREQIERQKAELVVQLKEASGNKIKEIKKEQSELVIKEKEMDGLIRYLKDTLPRLREMKEVYSQKKGVPIGEVIEADSQYVQILIQESKGERKEGLRIVLGRDEYQEYLDLLTELEQLIIQTGEEMIMGDIREIKNEFLRMTDIEEKYQDWLAEVQNAGEVNKTRLVPLPVSITKAKEDLKTLEDWLVIAEQYKQPLELFLRKKVKEEGKDYKGYMESLVKLRKNLSKAIKQQSV